MRHPVNPFSRRNQEFNYDAGWVSVQFGGNGQPNDAGWYHCRCPCCGPSYGEHGRHSLSLRNINGRLRVKCFRACDAQEIHHRIGLMVRCGDYEAAPAVDPRRHETGSPLESRVLKGAQVWHASSPSNLAQVYYSERCINLDKVPVRWEDIRVHPAHRHPDAEQYSPAIIALRRDVNNAPLAVHRTWLSPDGKTKAGFVPAKMSLGPSSGTAIRLTEADKEVLIGEGVETTLSAIELHGMPGWAAGDTSCMISLRLPPAIRRVVIAADADVPGLKAAEQLRRRLELEGRKVSIITPKDGFKDFNDYLRLAPMDETGGVEAFPSKVRWSE